MDSNSSTDLWLEAAAERGRPLYLHRLPLVLHCQAAEALRSWRQEWPERGFVGVPHGSTGEVVLFLLADGSVSHGRKNSPLPDSAIAVALVDSMWASPNRLALSSSCAVCPSDSSLTVVASTEVDEELEPKLDATIEPLAVAALAAVWTSAKEVQPDNASGRPIQKLYVDDIEAAITELQQVVIAVEHQRYLLGEGKPLDRRRGHHCWACDDKWRCDEFLQLVRLVLATHSSSITGHQMARQLANRYEHLQSIVRSVSVYLRNYVRDHGPIDIGGGQFWGRSEKAARSMQGLRAYDELKDMVGELLASRAIHITQNAAREAFKQSPEHSAEPPTKLVAELLQRCKDAEAIKTFSRAQWGPFKGTDDGKA